MLWGLGLLLLGAALAIYFQRQENKRLREEVKTNHREAFAAGEIARQEIATLKVQLASSAPKEAQWDLTRDLTEERNKVAYLGDALLAAEKNFAVLQEEYNKLLGQKKSSEVRVGLVAEQLSPFLSDFPCKDPKNVRHLATPIDFVAFDEDRVVFIEVKSGEAQLSTKQRQIRDQIREGKVDFEVYRINGKPGE